MTIVPPGGGELLRDAPERRLEILCEHDALHAMWSRLGPGGAGTDLHVHRRHADVFYVLDGELTIRLGADDDRVVAPAGTLAVVPALVVHGFLNGSDADVRYLNFHAPGTGFAGYLRALVDGRSIVYDQEPPPADGGRSNADALFASSSADGGGGVLADAEAIAVAEVVVAGSDPAAPPSVRPGHLESLYVLDGELAVRAGDGELRARAGSWVQVRPGVASAVSSAGSESARYLDVRTPAT